MTNIDRAAEHMDSLDRLYNYGSGHEPSNAGRAQALADATPPLLMPDLPEPDNTYPEWLSGGVSISPGLNAGEVDIEWEDRMLRLAPGQVLAFLSAANYAERNQA